MRICLICGGPSQERGISLNSARSIMDHLTSIGWEIIPIYCDPDLKFYRLSPSQLYSNTPYDFDFKLAINNQPLEDSEFTETCKKADIVFPVIHGAFGEDGELQELLDEKNIRFIGSSSISCRRMFDKVRANSEIAKMVDIDFGTLPNWVVSPSY
jgi:D-alanine-D-alanine ligase-like ATP-grasp enzyme